MSYFVGIDLGTTNSSICSYDCKNVRVWRSPEQNNVTPSAILFDKRGNRFVGKRAYDASPVNRKNVAMLFKRIMGTNTKIHIECLNKDLTPEECSAEILRTLYGYLPEEIRRSEETCTVITVPASFNQMQKNATIEAARLAKIGKVALMMEPVAAVISAMRKQKKDGTYLIYDLGGGTFDVSLAEVSGGHIVLLAQGGIQVCGGRDFDREMLKEIVLPWINNNYNFGHEDAVQKQNPEWDKALSYSLFVAERAKIELSSKNNTFITSGEGEIKIVDTIGKEFYLEIPIERATFNAVANCIISDTIKSCIKTMKRAGVAPKDVNSIIFIGGPTNYKPLRDEVVKSLQIKSSYEDMYDISLDPMTAVAEGAAIFAESIDWDSDDCCQKNVRGQIVLEDEFTFTFNYHARTPDSHAEVLAVSNSCEVTGYEFQVDNLQTGWTSGRQILINGAKFRLPLDVLGENHFQLFVFDDNGEPVDNEELDIVITKTAAIVDTIPASHSIGFEVRNSAEALPTLDYIVQAGDCLPVKGRKVFKAEECLRAGEMNSINFKLWEGEHNDCVDDNLFVGVMKIHGIDFFEGVIYKNAELVCEYEVLTSGVIKLIVSVPCIGNVFKSNINFYSRKEGEIDYNSDIAARRIRNDANIIKIRLQKLENVVGRNEEIEEIYKNMRKVLSLLDSKREGEHEDVLNAAEHNKTARDIVADMEKLNKKKLLSYELNGAVDQFKIRSEKYAEENEIKTFNNLVKNAQQSIEKQDSRAEVIIKEINSLKYRILWRQGSFRIEQYKIRKNNPGNYEDANKFSELIRSGDECLQKDNMDGLFSVICGLDRIERTFPCEEDMLIRANIIKV